MRQFTKFLYQYRSYLLSLVVIFGLILATEMAMYPLLIEVYPSYETLIKDEMDFFGDPLVFTISILRATYAAAFSYVLVSAFRKNWDHARFFQVFITLSSLVVLAIVLSIVLLFPRTAAILIGEDGLIENMSAVFLLLASLFMLCLLLRYAFQKKIIAPLIALLMMIVFIFMGMEEISWGQRIFDTEPSDFFIENNQQQETNIHNLNSELFNQILYIGALISLVIVPYISEGIKKLLDKTNFKSVAYFIPSRWLLVPLSAAFGFVLPMPWTYAAYLIGLFVAAFILISETQYYSSKKDPFNVLMCVSSLILLTVAAVVFTLNGGIYVKTPNLPREWFEMFVAMGLLVYALDLNIRGLGSVRKRPNRL